MEQNSPQGPNWRVRILVIEDDEDLQKILKLHLENEGFEIIQAFDGKEGLDLVKEMAPDIVLLDLMMPEMDGFETCKRIKSVDSTREIPVIVVSAKEAIKDKLTCFTFQADDYMVKPYDYEELCGRIYLHLGKAVNHQEVRERDRKRATKNLLADLSEKMISAREGIERQLEALRNNVAKKCIRQVDDVSLEVTEMLRLVERLREESDPLYASPHLPQEAIEAVDEI